MGLQKPHFSVIDGTKIYVNDLERLSDYVEELRKFTGQVVKDGILHGLALTSSDGVTATLGTGAAMTETGDIIVLNSDDSDVSISVALIAAAGIQGQTKELWLYKFGTDDTFTKTRSNIGSGTVIVADKDNWALELVTPGTNPQLPFPRVKIAQTLEFNTDPSAFTWSNTGTYFNYFYALKQLSYLNKLINGRYSGKLITEDGLGSSAVDTDNIVDGAITNDKVSDIDGSKFLDSSIDASTKLSNDEFSGTLLTDYTLSRSKLDRSIKRTVKMPTVLAMPYISNGEVGYYSVDTFDKSTGTFSDLIFAFCLFGEIPTDISTVNFDNIVWDKTVKDFIEAKCTAIDPSDNIVFSRDRINVTETATVGQIDVTGDDAYTYSSIAPILSDGYGFWLLDQYPSGGGYPNAIKICNYLPRSLGYPDYIDIIGQTKLARQSTSTELNQIRRTFTSGATTATKTPIALLSSHIVPPDGYVVDNIQAVLVINSEFVDRCSWKKYPVCYTWSIHDRFCLAPPSKSWNMHDHTIYIGDGSMLGTYDRAIVSYSGFEDLFHDNTTVLDLRISLRYVDPTDIGKSLSSGGAIYDSYSTDSNPFYLHMSVWNSKWKVWTFIDRDALLAEDSATIA